MPDTSFWDAPNRTAPINTDRLGMQRGLDTAGEHITLGQIRDYTYEQVSLLTQKLALTGSEELFIRYGLINKKTTVNALSGEGNFIPFPTNSIRYVGAGGSQALRYRKERNKVSFQGAVAKFNTETINATTALIGTLPVGFRPTFNVKFMAATSSPYKPNLITVASNGNVSIELLDGSTQLENGMRIELSSCFFYID